ncbi:MAG: cobalt ECF transporter T component CbiQ [Planctomycetes bacterium]|jgi:cobalt/nickel transport system permease protein|nr:cobalt ECF transporter T component CbiQ [Planctomycetota bacterium]
MTPAVVARAGPLHRLPAGLKLAAATAGVVGLAFAPRDAFAVFGGGAAVVVLLVLLSRVPPGRFLRRLLLVEPFAAGAALLALFPPGGLLWFLGLLARTTLCLALLILLTLTTRFTDLLGVLRRIRLPRLFVTTLALAHRYLFVLAEEAARLRRARKSRTFSRRRGAAWRGSAAVAAGLFIRSFDRAERVHRAMRARGLPE